MSGSQCYRFITWVKHQWNLPNFWLVKANLLGIAFLGMSVLGCGTKVETKVDAKKEETVVETKKAEVKIDPVKPKEEIQIKEDAISNRPPLKLPYSKVDMLAFLNNIKIADPSSVVDGTSKDKEEYQKKIKDSLEKEVKKVVDEYIKLGDETLPAEMAKIKKSIKDTFEEFLKDKDDKWVSKATNDGELTKKDVQSGLTFIMNRFEGTGRVDSSLENSSCSVVGVNYNLVNDYEKHKLKVDKIAKDKPRATYYDTVLSGFLDPDKELTVENNNTSAYFLLFYASGGKKETVVKLENEHDLFLTKYQKIKFITEAKKKLLQELSLIKKDLEGEIENDSLGDSKHREILSILIDKKKIFFSASSQDRGKPILKNILTNKSMEYENCEKEIVDAFREQVDIEPIKNFLSIFDMETKNEEAREKERQEIIKAEEAKAELEAKRKLAQDGVKLEALKAKAEKIRNSKKYTEIDSFELALLVFPPTMNISDFTTTKDFNSLTGKIYELSAAQCMQPLGAGKAMMKLSFSDTPILIEPFNATFANTAYVDKKYYTILVKFVGPTSYTNMFKVEKQALKAQVIYMK